MKIKEDAEQFEAYLAQLGYVKVIQCKDCKFWSCDDDETFCSEWGAYGTDYKSYCSYGKRKEK